MAAGDLFERAARPRGQRRQVDLDQQLVRRESRREQGREEVARRHGAIARGTAQAERGVERE